MDKFPEKELADLRANAAEMDAGAGNVNRTLITAIRNAKSICRDIDTKRVQNVEILDGVIKRMKAYYEDQKRRRTMAEEDLSDYWDWIREVEAIRDRQKNTEADLFSLSSYQDMTQSIRELARQIREDLFTQPGGAA